MAISAAFVDRMQTSGAISLEQVRNKFKSSSGSISMSELYRGGTYVFTSSYNNSIAASGSISLGSFYGSASRIAVTVTGVEVNLTVGSNIFGTDWGQNIPKTLEVSGYIISTSTGSNACTVSTGRGGSLRMNFNSGGGIYGAGGSGGGGGAGGPAIYIPPTFGTNCVPTGYVSCNYDYGYCTPNVYCYTVQTGGGFSVPGAGSPGGGGTSGGTALFVPPGADVFLTGSGAIYGGGGGAGGGGGGGCEGGPGGRPARIGCGWWQDCDHCAEGGAGGGFDSGGSGGAGGRGTGFINTALQSTSTPGAGGANPGNGGGGGGAGGAGGGWGAAGAAGNTGGTGSPGPGGCGTRPGGAGGGSGGAGGGTGASIVGWNRVLSRESGVVLAGGLLNS